MTTAEPGFRLPHGKSGVPGALEASQPHKSADGTAIEAETEKLGGRTPETIRLVGRPPVCRLSGWDVGVQRANTRVPRSCALSTYLLVATGKSIFDLWFPMG